MDAWDEKTVFLQALSLPRDQRETFLKTQCPDQQAMDRIWALIRHHEAAPDDFLANSTVTATPPPGGVPVSQIGEFKILHRLGEGGMGVVYLAEDTILGRRVALKVLARHLIGSEQALARFREEARSAAVLNHPAIVPVYKFARDGDDFYLVSEFVDGRTLAELIIEKRRVLVGASTQDIRAWHRHAAEIVAIIADALDCAHRAKIVHRDVKPSNILIDPQRGPRLTDFGIAKHLTEESRTSHTGVIGSCHYMSPEQADIASTSIDQRSDIFSLGVVLYEMLGLRLPFEGASVQQVLKAVSECSPPRLRAIDRRIPVDLETICHKSIEKRPSDRYQTAAHVAADLRCYLAGDPILAKPPSMGRKLRRLLRRHSWSGLLFSTVGLSLVLSGVEYYRWRMARCELTLSGIRTHAKAYVRSIGANFLVGPPEYLGEIPIRSTRLLPGHYRIETVGSDDFEEIEAVLDTPNCDYQIEVPVIASQTRMRDMVRIPSGRYKLGRQDGDSIDALKVVDLPAFWIDQYEVSNQQYKEFADLQGRIYPLQWQRFGFDEKFAAYPVVGISWDDMQAYARWKGKRLPSVLEWEAAARYPDGRLYPWRNPPAVPISRARLEDYQAERATDWAAAYEIYKSLARPVAADPELASQLGIHNLFGNVSEMTGSTFGENMGIIAIKGGTWFDTPEKWDLTRSSAFPRTSVSMNVGFRCARSDAPMAPKNGD